MNVRWRLILLLGIIAGVVDAALGAAIRLLRSFFGLGLLEILFILVRSAANVAFGACYAFFGRRPSPLSFGDAVIGGALTGGLSRLLSGFALSMLDALTLFLLETGSYTEVGTELWNPSPLTRWFLAGLVVMTLGALWTAMLSGFSSGACAVLLSPRRRPIPPPAARQHKLAVPADVATEDHVATEDDVATRCEVAIPDEMASDDVTMPESSGPGSPSRTVLNPFAFPVDTQSRSSLLILAIGALSWLYGFAALIGFFAIPDDFMAFERVRRPVVEAWRTHLDLPEGQYPFDLFRGPPYDPSARVAELEQELAAYRDGSNRTTRQVEEILGELLEIQLTLVGIMGPYFAVPAAFVAMAAILWIGLYSSHGIRLRRFGRLQGISGDSPLAQLVTDLVDEIRNPPDDAGDGDFARPELFQRKEIQGDGQVFGFPGRYRIALTSSLSCLLKKEDERSRSIRALVLHELAHIANRDVERSYLAAAGWIVIAPLTFLWILASLIEVLYLRSPTVARFLIPFAFQMAFTLVSIELVRRSLLRGREHFADLRAAHFWSAREALLTALGARPARAFLSPWRRIAERLRGLTKNHPYDHERQKMIRDPDAVFRVRSDVAYLACLTLNYILLMLGTMLFAGISVIPASLNAAAATKAFQYLETADVTTAIEAFHSIKSYDGLLYFISATLICIGCGYIITSTVGVQVQRMAVAQLARGQHGPRSYLQLLRPAFFCAAGLGSGLLVIPFMPNPGIAQVFRLGLWLVFAAFAMWLWMSGTYFFAQRLLGSYVGSSPPHGRRRFLSLFSIVSLAVAFFAIYFALGGLLSVKLDESMSGWQQWDSALIPGCAIVLLVVLLVAMGFLLGLGQSFKARLFPPRCPSCDRITTRNPAVTESCEHCAQALAPWLFVPLARQG